MEMQILVEKARRRIEECEYLGHLLNAVKRNERDTSIQNKLARLEFREVNDVWIEIEDWEMRVL